MSEIRPEELSDAEVNELLERFDQTEARLQRRVVVQFMADSANFRARAEKAEGELASLKTMLSREPDWEAMYHEMQTEHEKAEAEVERLKGRLADSLPEAGEREYDEIENRNAGASIAANKLREITETGKPADFVGPEMQLAAQAIVALHADRDRLRGLALKLESFNYAREDALGVNPEMTLRHHYERIREIDGDERTVGD